MKLLLILIMFVFAATAVTADLSEYPSPFIKNLEFDWRKYYFTLTYF